VIAGTTFSLAMRPVATSVLWANTGKTILQNPDNGTLHLKFIFGFCPRKSLSTVQDRNWPPSSVKERGRGRGEVYSAGANRRSYGSEV
jgi:hypothetical protein